MSIYELVRHFRARSGAGHRASGWTSRARGAGAIAVSLVLSLAAWGQATSAPAAEQAAAAPPPATGPDLTTQALAAYAAEHQLQSRGLFNEAIEHLVDSVLVLFHVPASGNTTIHFIIAGAFLVIAFLLRRALTGLIFGCLRRLSARTPWTFDDRFLNAIEPPASAAIVVFGIFAALSVLKLPLESDRILNNASTVAFSLLIFWAVLRGFTALLDHASAIAARRQLGIAGFMPWIRKTLLAIFFVLGALIVVQSLGYDVKAILAGLGIGGLAVALAAQDTIANVFGSVVVAIDQPFRIGEFVKIGAFDGTVEDIGLRSTRLRQPGGNLITLPNKTVAAEAVINHSRYTRRRVEHVIGLTYDTNADKMETIVQQIRALIVAEPEVDRSSVFVYFRDYNASSLDVWIAYNINNPDFVRAMDLRQRVNLAIMRAVEAAGLSFAFPTQTVHLTGDRAREIEHKARQETAPDSEA